MDIRRVMELDSRDLAAYAHQLDIPKSEELDREALTFQIICGLFARAGGKEMPIEGVLSLEGGGRGKGTALLRYSSDSYLPSHEDVLVPMELIRKYGLKTGDHIKGFIGGPPTPDMRFLLSRISMVNGRAPVSSRHRREFKSLTPIPPKRWLRLEYENPPSQSAQTICRMVDLVAPIGRGQRALIVAPPRTGKTVLMREIARSIELNHPDVYQMMLLVDERPEEVTQMQEALKSEVLSSNFDDPPEEHVKVAEMALEKAKSMVEFGRDVVIVLDSITRLARSYNTMTPSSGRVLTGGVDSTALEKPKKFFGAARAFREGGSLTIIATALVETGSRMDEVIFEEFKGTGNAEIVLDRKLAERRLYPAIDVGRSGTRQDELFFDEQSYSLLEKFRQVLMQDGQPPVEIAQRLRESVRQTKNNSQLLMQVNELAAKAGYPGRVRR